MPPEDIASAARIRKVRSFIGNYFNVIASIKIGVILSNGIVCTDFATALQSKLSDPLDIGNIEVLIADTNHHIQQIHSATQPGSSGPLPLDLAKEAERQGGNLWNLCVRLRRGGDAAKPTESNKLIVKARSFA